MSRVSLIPGTLPRQAIRGLRGLGDQIYDPSTGTYVDALPPADNPYSAPPFIGPPLPSGATSTSGASSSDLSWLLQNVSSEAPLTPATSLSLPSRPSPVLSMPLTPSSIGLWFSGSTAGIPNWALLAGVAVGGLLLLSGGSRRRR